MRIDFSPRLVAGLTLLGVVTLAQPATRMLYAGESVMSERPASVPGSAERQVIQPSVFPDTGLPYSPGILVGDTLYLSGQLGRDPETATLVPGGIEAETRQALENLGEVLHAAGMDYQHVVSVTAFLADFADFPKFNEVYREVFTKDPPARATVQVAGLNLGARVEIQMIAAKPLVPETSADRHSGSKPGRPVATRTNSLADR
jgi:2-iminobutanoate/2-iminopropanoate deaminase